MELHAMGRLDRFLAYTESHRRLMLAVSAALIALIAWADAALPYSSIGFLYLVPVLLCASVLSATQIVLLAAFCGWLRERFDPLEWSAGAEGRLAVAIAGFAMTGFFVVQLNQRRRLLLEHLAEREEQMRLRHEAEMQVRILIETSPLAILTLDRDGRVVLANESARQLLGFEPDTLQGENIEPYLPILHRMLRSHRPSANMRTNVECKGQAAQRGDLPGARVALHLRHERGTRPGGGGVGRQREPARPRRRRPGFDDGHIARAGGRHLPRDPQPGLARPLLPTPP